MIIYFHIGIVEIEKHKYIKKWNSWKIYGFDYNKQRFIGFNDRWMFTVFPINTAENIIFIFYRLVEWGKTLSEGYKNDPHKSKLFGA